MTSTESTVYEWSMWVCVCRTNLSVWGRYAFASVHPNEGVFLNRNVELQELWLVDVQLRPPKHAWEKEGEKAGVDINVWSQGAQRWEHNLCVQQVITQHSVHLSSFELTTWRARKQYTIGYYYFCKGLRVRWKVHICFQMVKKAKVPSTFESLPSYQPGKDQNSIPIRV